jgi:hypothetical protein
MTSNTVSHVEIGTLFEAARLNAVLDSGAQSHLEGCDLCRSRMNWMKTATSMGPAELSYEPPEEALNRVLKLGRASAPLKRLRKFIVASLSFDSFAALAPAGVRRAESAERQMTFEADGIDISLSIRPQQNSMLTVTGQVLTKAGEPITDAAARVDLVRDGDHVATSTLSPWGEFVFEDVERGTFEVQISLTDRLLRTPSV